jgi:hypothetical protein
MTPKKKQDRHDKEENKMSVGVLTLIPLVYGISLASSHNGSSHYSTDGGVHSGSISSRGEDSDLAFLSSSGGSCDGCPGGLNSVKVVVMGVGWALGGLEGVGLVGEDQEVVHGVVGVDDGEFVVAGSVL